MALFHATRTRYVKNPQPKAVKIGMVDVGAALVPLLTGEAQGDYDLAALLAVRNMLQNPKHMCFKHRALNALGQETETTSHTAKRWNVHGAIELVTYGWADRKRRTVLLGYVRTALPQEYRNEPLFRFLEDDKVTHGRVMAVLNMAIFNRKQELGYGKA